MTNSYRSQVLSLALAASRGEDLCAVQASELYRGESDAACRGMDQHPVTALDPAMDPESKMGGQEGDR
jgi:hypothetical protein